MTTINQPAGDETRANVRNALVSLECTAQWLENGCDPKAAAHELRLVMNMLHGIPTALASAAPFPRSAATVPMSVAVDARRMRTLCRLLDAMDDMGTGFPGEVHAAFQDGGEKTRRALDAAAMPEDLPSAHSAATDAATVSDEREAFIADVAAQKPENPDHWSSCGQCERNIERAQDLLAEQSAAPQASTEPESSCDPGDICAGCRCKYNTYADPIPRASEQADDYCSIHCKHACQTSTNGVCNGPPVTDEAVTDAARDVVAERKRQVTVEGFTAEHDAKYPGAMAKAAATYAAHAGAMASIGYEVDYEAYRGVPVHQVSAPWPWDDEWWKPTTVRHDLVKAGALLLAEIERLDRAEDRS
ncbi:hypothetical protein [Paraburkholderia sp. MM5477-R1]|uniref:hypothetical protein n=1 Tax=Paraburkholderia sp. MM5477-R1 TaxID=2991062 RepID=UPI003D220C25